MATQPIERKLTTINYATRARWATVRVETEGANYVGRVYIPETKKRLSDVLSDERLFISLTDVSMNDSSTVEPFIAINKSCVRTVRVLHEGASDAMPNTTLRTVS